MSSVFVVGVGVIFPCPFCKCEFSCESDLNSHLTAFGVCCGIHLWRLIGLHRFLDDGVSRLYGGADRVVREIAWVVLHSRGGSC